MSFYQNNDHAEANAKSQAAADERRKREWEAQQEWEQFEKPTLEQRIQNSNERLQRAVERSWGKPEENR